MSGVLKAVRLVVNGLLWAASVFGLFGAVLWIGQSADLIRPLIVISGSMQPGIGIGDLLIDRPIPVADVKVGQVVSLPSTLTHDLVSHRVVSIDQAGGVYSIRLKGDANATADAVPYVVQPGTKVWHPAIRIPHLGVVMQNVARPRVVIPLLIALTALSILLGLQRESEGRRRAGTER